MATSVPSETDGTTVQANESAIDVNLLKEIAKKALVDALNAVCLLPACLQNVRNLSTQVNGAKTLVLDAALAGPLGLVTEVSLLKVSSVFRGFHACFNYS